MSFGKKAAPAPMKPLNLVKIKAPKSAGKRDHADAAAPAMRHFTNDYPIIGTQALVRAPKDDRLYHVMLGVTIIVLLGVAAVMINPDLMTAFKI
jgi:hypothetical protein